MLFRSRKAFAIEGESAVTATRKRRVAFSGLMTIIAISLHNIPEGIAVYLTCLKGVELGLPLAIAMSLHNIPEGICVAMPIYYATGDRWKAFRWAFYSGLSEPVAALFGWVVLAAVMSDFIYGVLFGLVAGMMVNICVKELLPTAHRYDPEDTVATMAVEMDLGPAACGGCRRRSCTSRCLGWRRCRWSEALP